MMNKIKHQQFGFTLVELIVSISIFALITGTMLANFRAGDQSGELMKSAELVVSELREAQTKSLSGVGGVGVDGHGLYMTDGATNFFSYTDDSGNALSYDAGEQDIITGLMQGVEIDTDADILFAIPSGDLYNNGVLQTTDVTISFLHTRSGVRRDIVISAVSGRVNISDPY